MKQVTINTLKGMGAEEWKKGGHHRLYIGVAGEKAIGLTYTTYRNDQISSARLGGEIISNAQANRIILVVNAAYIDLATGALVITQPKGVSAYDFGKIKESLEDTLNALDAEAVEEEEVVQAAEAVKVQYEAGQSRMNPEVCVDYMLATTEGVELYAEAVNDTWDEATEAFTNESATYDTLKADILAQAEEKGIPANRLKFYYD